MTLDVLSVADLCVDLILTGDVRPRFGQVEKLVDDYVVELGGSAPIFASQFVKLGGRAGLVGAVGQDAFGKFVVDRLNQVGVDTSRLVSRADIKTGLGVALSEPHDRAILTYLGTIDTVTPEVLADISLLSCRHWHLAGYFLLSKVRDAWPNWLRRLREAHVSTSLDTNFDPEQRWEGVHELLPLVHVFLPNEEEAKALSGKSNVFDAGRELARHGPLVVIKRGRKGAMAWDGQKHWEVHHQPAPDIVDTTGAGDSFDAGFLRAWQLGHGVETCLKWGVRCGLASTAAVGGIEAQLREPLR